MSPRKPVDQPFEVAAEEGEVIIESKVGVSLSMTPEAAEETSNRLYDRTAEARGQRIMRPCRSPKTWA
jgi:hypothetical protein